VLNTYARMIKVSHTIFALPFALAASVLAWRIEGFDAVQLVLIVACMLFARSAAMGFNRVVDRDIDAKNPRTAVREIPAGNISVGAAWAFTGGSAAAFVVCAWLLSPLCAALSPIVLVVICGYSLTKRFTALCHVFLGLALALAPSCAWIAITGGITATPLVLSAIVGTWVAGFDIIYALQDADFDRDEGLHSIPSALGRKGALVVSALLHVLTLGALVALPFTTELSLLYWPGVVLIAGILAYEHWIVRPDDLSRVNQAFFQLNGYVSLAFFGVVLVAIV
jgi:4-hydroxybenzoate polyprenyltransferase